MATLAKTILVILVAALPFELNFLPVASSLQWLFVLLSAASLPLLLRERKRLLSDRLILAALVFVGTQWLAAAFAPEFKSNAALGALRVSMGFVLLCITLCVGDRRTLMRTWCFAAIVAAVYGLLDHYGAGIPKLFRPGQFFIAGTLQRLSGSFEYPNTAAAYFSMSLPIVWTTLQKRWSRIAGSVLLLLALILTYSRGAIIAALLMMVVWAVLSKARAMFLFAGIGIATFATFAFFEPILLQRFADDPIHPRFAAVCEPEFNKMRLPQDGTFELELRITNTGLETWETNSINPFTVSYRWYDPARRILVYKSFDFIPIPTPVRPQQSVMMRVPFRVPHENGILLLTWEVSQNDKNRFRDRGVFPGLVEVDIQPSTEPWFGHGDLSRWLSRDMSRMFVGIPFSRIELWKAGLDMVRKHPWIGVGLDNFRLLYGRYFGNYQWDTRIRSNSLYLELLTGSGIVGFIAFIVMMFAVRRNAVVPVIALGIFMIHGVVDVFLMTTPIYFAFWILMGLARSESGAASRDLRSLYDDAADQYDAKVDAVGDNALLRERFQKRLSDAAGSLSTILDFGCGTGTDAAWYASRGHHVIAFDISSGMVDKLHSRCVSEIAAGQIIPLSGDFTALQQELMNSGPVDAIGANFAVLNHVRDLGPLFRDLASQLRPGGVMLAAVLNPFYRFDMKSRWWWKGLLPSLWTGSIKMSGGVTTYRHFIRTIRRMAKPHFEVVDCESSVTGDSMNSNLLILMLRRTG